MSQPTIPEPMGFNQLSKAEQIQYVQMLWDKIANNPNDVEVPEEHCKILRERLNEYQLNPDNTKPAREVLDRLVDKYSK
jgi:putative addiction module component (TIGR02574 family)